MGDIAKSLFLQFLFLLFLFFSLNSKTIRGTGLKFCAEVGSNDPTYSDQSKCL